MRFSKTVSGSLREHEDHGRSEWRVARRVASGERRVAKGERAARIQKNDPTPSALSLPPSLPPSDDSRHGQLERIMRMPILLAQRPHHLFVNLLRIQPALLGDLRHDRVDRFPLFVLFLAFPDFFGRDTTFGEVDVSCGVPAGRGGMG